ncbi:MAG: hypothetical protein AMJ84_05745 [Acidithiobacillales bacterium SM23_46]|nr:MAG: hypothetical protein AMJ84_05745 [Acidithiobacillales bacterium SM23_46]
MVMFLLGLPAPGAAQTYMEYQTAMNVSDTLSGAPTYTPSRYYNPGGLTAALQGGPGAGAVPGMPGGPMSPYGMATFPGMTMPGMAPAGPPPPPPVKKILVLTGERVSCRVMGTLLEDIHYAYRPESEKGEYYDDGTHSDLQAGDNIWTNYSERNDVLSPEANRLKLVYMRLLDLCEETNPLEFFRIPVATEEPLTNLPRVSEEERDRDETFLRQWHRQFLALYRQDQQDPKSDFLPVFVPSGPRAPETPAPPEDQFTPYAISMDQYIQRTAEQATAPALVPVEVPVGATTARTGGSTYRRPSRTGGGAAYAGNRWQQLRGQAADYGSYQMGGYFAR